MKVKNRISGFVLIPLIISVILLILLPFALYYFSQSSLLQKNLKESGVIGDTLGGIAGPIVGLIGALLTFAAFWIQYKFNEYQTNKIEQQDNIIALQEKTISKDKFENRFYELLNIHRANVAEISIKDVSVARRAFISMFKEYRFCYYELISIYRRHYSHLNLSEDDYMNISYLTFFFGIGESSGNLVSMLENKYDKNFINMYVDRLKRLQDGWNNTSPGNSKLMTTLSEEGDTIKLTTGYAPFNGHISRLNHYFRHLYNTVKYVHDQPASFLTSDEKKEYIKTLRAQLSAHEQILLYYNSLSVLGKSWETEGFISEYKLIKNIPIPLADFGINPSISYSEPNFFEWYEIESRLNAL